MKKTIFLIILTLFILFLIFFAKIDISNFVVDPLKKEIKEITGLNISIGKIHLHIFPLYVEIQNLSYKDDKNYLNLQNAKIYLSFQNIFNREIDLKRIVLLNFNFSFDNYSLNTYIDNIKSYLQKPSQMPLKFKIKSIEIENLSGSVYKEDKILAIYNLNGRGIIKKEPIFNIISNVKLSIPGYPNINTNIKVSFYIKKDNIELQELKFFDIHSLLKSDGSLNYKKFLGEFLITGKIFFNSLMNFLGIKDKSTGQIDLNGKVIFKEGEKFFDKIHLKINFKGFFFIEDLMKLLKVSEKLEGYTEVFNGKIEGSISDIQASAKAKQKDCNILGIKIKHLETDVFYKQGILEFKSNDISLYGGKGKAHVWINIPVVSKHYIFVEVNNVSSSGIFDLIQWNPDIAEGVIDGWLLSEGKVFSPKGSFVYLRKLNVPDDVRGKINSIRGDFESNGEIYNFKLLDFTLNQTKISANGLLNLKDNTLNFNFQGKTEDIDELLNPYQKAFHGDAYFKGILIGKTSDPQINLEFSSKKINIFLNEFITAIGKEPLVVNDLIGEIQYRKNMLNIDKIFSSEMLSIKGKINFPNAKTLFDFKEPIYDIDFVVKNLIIDNLYLETIKNYLNTKLNITGSVKGKGDIDGNINSSGILLGRNKIFDKFSAFIKYKDNSLIINESSFHLDSDNLYLNGMINFNGEINISGKSDKFNIVSFIKNFSEKIGMKNVQEVLLKNLKFYIKNNYKTPEINAESDFSITSKSGKPINGFLKSNYSKDILNINSSLLKSAKLDVTGFLQKKEWDIKGNFNSTRIDSILGLFVNNLPEDLVILIDGKMNGLFNEKINAQVNLNRLFTRLYGVGISNKSSVNINIKNNNVYIEPITLIGQSTELTIKGKILDYFDILIDGYTDLKPFKSIFKVDDIRGRASILVYIYEHLKHPEIAGEVDVIDGSLTLKKDIPTLNNINATVSFNEDRVLIEKAKGTFAEGNLQIGGALYLKDFSIDRYALTGNFSDVRWIFTSRSWAFLNGEVYLTGSNLNPQLVGNIKINRGIYMDNIDFVNLALKSSSSKNSIDKDSWLNNLSLNLRLQCDSFSMNNNIAEMVLKGDLLLRGTFINPSLLGWIISDEGWIYFRGNKFEILRLLVQFNDTKAIRPYLNISARTYVSQYNVNLNINGYIDQFNLILNSNPPLAENDLLNLLLIGQNGTAKEGIPGLSDATSFITGQIQGVIQERVRGIIGLDVLSVEPGISKTTGTVTPRITIGKKLMDGKLNVTYTTATGTTAEQIIKIEYVIKKGISIVGLRDEIGGLSGAIKFRFEFH